MDEPTYTVYIRVPIPRGDFVDPPAVRWDASKDEELWNIVSAGANAEIDWNQLAVYFDASVDFILQQVTYLTKRHASQVRAQVRKAAAAAKGSNTPSPVPGSEALHHRAPSALSIRRDSPLPRAEGSGAGTPISTSVRPILSRNTSGNTPFHGSALGTGSTSRTGKGPGRVGETGAGRRRLSSLPMTAPPQPPSPGPAESSSEASSDESSSPAQSRIIRRPPRFGAPDEAASFADDDEDDTEPAFQPYKPAQSSAQDLGATLRGDPREAGKRRETVPARGRADQSQTSDSSASSAAFISRNPKSGERRPPGPLSPRRAAELAGKGKGVSREGSDGTPSMGSSYSDLDDASVTQSALEEALLSKMQEGAGSRFSISQAIKSRYGPK